MPTSYHHKITFAQEGLEECIELLRFITGCPGPDLRTESARQNLENLITLRALAEKQFGGGLISIESYLITTGASETLVFLKPTERLRQCGSAVLTVQR